MIISTFINLKCSLTCTYPHCQCKANCQREGSVAACTSWRPYNGKSNLLSHQNHPTMVPPRWGWWREFFHDHPGYAAKTPESKDANGMVKVWCMLCFTDQIAHEVACDEKMVIAGTWEAVRSTSVIEEMHMPWQLYTNLILLMWIEISLGSWTDRPWLRVACILHFNTCLPSLWLHLPISHHTSQRCCRG